MRIDLALYWCTNLELLEAKESEEWFDRILNFLVEKQFDGVLAISSADAFTAVNKKIGREAGNSVLKSIWEVSSSEPFVKFGARLDGDGLIFIFDSQQGKFEDYIEKHLVPFCHADSISISRSLGCSIIPAEWARSTDDWNLVIEAADMAHTHAKKRGGNMAIRCVNPLGLLTEDHNKFFWKGSNFEVIKSGDPSRFVYEPRDGSACG